MSHKGSAGDHEIGPGGIEGFIHEEIFLLPSKIGVNLVHGRVEKTTDRCGGIRHRPERLLQRSLVIQCLSGVGDEHGRDAKGVIHDEYRGCGIPGRVASGLESSPYSAIGER